MSLKVGIIGLPNVGKSTLFNALIKANKAAVSNFPFCTIEPNTGTVPVPDKRLAQLAELTQATKVIPATVEFVDIAGLVKDAHKGKGLGNQFLSHIREVDALLQVVRVFSASAEGYGGPAVARTSASEGGEDEKLQYQLWEPPDPKRDIETVNTELLMADLQTLSRCLEEIQKRAKAGKKDTKKEVGFHQRLFKHIDQGNPARTLEIGSENEKMWMKELHLLTFKPIMYALNISENQVGKSGVTEFLEEFLKKEQTPSITISAKTESELNELTEEEKIKYLKELTPYQEGLPQVIQTGYRLLGLVSFFTIKGNFAQAWELPQGSTALEAAAKVHSDFAKKFIKAEAIGFEELKNCGSWQRTKELGKLRQEGKEYVVQDGEVITFKTGN